MDMFGKLGWFFKQERKAYIFGISMLILLSVMTALVPMIIGIIIDNMTAGTITGSQLVIWSVILVVIAIVQYAMRYVWRTKIFGTSAKLEKILRARLFNHFTQMDSIFFQKYRTGDLMARTTNDLNSIRMVAGGGILTLVDSLSQGLLTLFMMFFFVDWRLTLVSIIPIPLLTILIRFVGRKLHYHSRKSQAAFSSMNDKVQESVTGMKVIKTFGEEELDIEDFKKMTTNVVDRNQKVYLFDAAFRPTSQLIMGAATILGVFFGGFLVSQGEITIGLLVAFISYVARLQWPMIAIGRLFNILERGSASYDRILEILNEKSTIIEEPDALSQSISGDIHIDIDEFAYPDNDDKASLRDIDIHIKQGNTLGIVGRTGSGKTSLFKLLLRDYDQFKGDITFNGISIKDYQLDSLLANIGYVPQDNFLFSTTVRDNIRFANMDTTNEEVEEIAKVTRVHEDILGFSEGYDTLVGERGVALSGGQKQRISMARAMLINPELLILDDSLSAVDAKTEEAILNSIKETREDKSTIISAHRLSSVMHADEIVVLDEGQIVERGTHEELINNNGWYQEMYEHQQLELSSEMEEV
ncbi:ATP-binding cassette domain-containing protein [Aerococcaceae bacterium INB8]|uniref:ATP-binding cassette domain-containing protein n=1 Tax=Ruoffia halotolerans TaxID=2748684 RepID=A0A839A4U0_9LACT|nr:ABC transporter transmembrane domain-containing protein [Ruoffia halotolerans]MBA5729017.1 ATP-binding cassette domain-containing protein [Ruoffia halotolerans]